MGTYTPSYHEKMLANLASLIWGGEGTTPATTTAFPDAGHDTTPNKFNIRAATPADEEEADWLLVDRAEVGEASGGDEDPTSLQEEASVCRSAEETRTTLTTRAMTPVTTAITTTNNQPSPASSVPSTPTPPTSGGDLNEGAQGWLVTPPPCFTRSQAAPLATSPLENLLIEHPSMSVYLPRPVYISTASIRVFPQRLVSHSNSPPSASPSSQSGTGEREESPMREEAGNEGGGQVVEAAPAPRSGVQAHRSPTLLQAIDILRPAQKAQRRREERRLKRAPLERSNKAIMVASQGNKRSKRCDNMTPAKCSRAVNNRKC